MNREDFKYLKIIIPISIIAFFSILWIRPADLWRQEILLQQER